MPELNFKSKTALAQHFKQLEKDGWISSEWKLTYYKKDGKDMTKGIRMFKINFNNIPPKNNERG